MCPTSSVPLLHLSIHHHYVPYVLPPTSSSIHRSSSVGIFPPPSHFFIHQSS
jgi:hypothetical protein